ncbi:MAG: DUF1285 domain-containing protein [Magnetospiraceae bacterium]
MNEKEPSSLIPRPDTGAAPVFRPDGLPGILDLPHAPRRVLCGDLDMRIDADGTWYYGGTPIGRKEMVRLFATVLHRAADGLYWLATPAEMGRIAVEDAPFLVVAATVKDPGPNQVVQLRTNLDDVVPLDDTHPLRVEVDSAETPRPYVVIRRRLEARINRATFYHLVDLAEMRESDSGTELQVRSAGRWFSLGAVEAE